MIDMTNEHWRSVSGYEGLYSVSNFGRVRSERRVIQEGGRKDSWKPKSYVVKEKILKASPQITCGRGYHRVSLSKNSKIKYFFVHWLVAWAFIGPQERGVEIRHIDGNSRNNRLDNLCYGSKSDNMQDAKRHGTLPRWEDRPGAKLDRYKVVEICKRGLDGERAEDIAKDFGVNTGAVHQVWRGETWADFTYGIRPNRRIEKFSTLTNEQLRLITDTSKTTIQIAKELGINRHTVSNWRKKIIEKR